MRCVFLGGVWAEAGRWEVCSVVWWCGVVVRKRFRVRAWAGRWVGGAGGKGAADVIIVGFVLSFCGFFLCVI